MYSIRVHMTYKKIETPWNAYLTFDSHLNLSLSHSSKKWKWNEFCVVFKHFYVKLWRDIQIKAELVEIHEDSAPVLKTTEGKVNLNMVVLAPKVKCGLDHYGQSLC